MQYLCNQEEWRLKRLQKATRIACAIMGLTEQQAELLIQSIQDERGLLAVTWNQPWTKQQELAFNTAWGECGEQAASVVHIHSRELARGAS